MDFEDLLEKTGWKVGYTVTFDGYTCNSENEITGIRLTSYGKTIWIGRQVGEPGKPLKVTVK